MPIIKETIKNNNQDVLLKISIGGNNHLTGYQQEIDSFVEETKIKLINPTIDYEVSRFRYASIETLQPTYLLFYLGLGTNFSNVFYGAGGAGAGFTPQELTSESMKVLNSFFIMDFYDTFDNNTQTKIFTQYLTQITTGLKSGSYPIPKYKIYSDTVNQFYYWYVPKSFLDIQTGFTATGYVKFSFYNAKYGTLALFYNADITDQYSPERLYFKAKLDLIKMTWEFDYSGTNYPYDVVARQLPFTNKYSERANAAMNNFDNLRQVPPTGNTFQVSDGDYITV